MTIWCMRIAWWIHTATNTHSEYVIRTIFPLQQWLNERASILRFTSRSVLLLKLGSLSKEMQKLLISRAAAELMEPFHVSALKQAAS